MVNRQKQIKLLEEFMETLNVEGICGFWIEDDDKELPAVYIVLDLDWIKVAQTKPEFIAKRMRAGVKEEINKWLGFDVYVGSTAKKCEKINESIIETQMMNEIDLKDLIIETISEEMFIMRRKIEMVAKILINYNSIDCDNLSKESYQRIYCDNMKGWSYEKVENLKNNLQEKLYNLIKQEVRKSKFLKK
jgi:hypothetical protein